MLTDISPYKDTRREFFQGWFNTALPYEEYLKQSPEGHQEKWKVALTRISLSDTQRNLIKSFTRKMNLLVLSGSWCGDCVRQGPMLELIRRESDLLDLRFVDNRSNPEIAEELRINGAEKVPVVVILSEDFLELQRFGDRHLSVYRRLVEEARLKDSGAYCDTGLIPSPDNQLKEEIEEWLQCLERAQYILQLSPLLKKRYQNL